MDNTECWEWNGARTPDGYGVKRINGTLHYTHRLAWEWANGPIPKGMFVCHRCDNPPCCNPDHLFMGTPSDNMQDCSKKNRISRRNSAILTKEDVVRIRASTGPYKEIGKIFGVHQTTICNVKTRKTWKDV